MGCCLSSMVTWFLTKSEVEQFFPLKIYSRIWLINCIQNEFSLPGWKRGSGKIFQPERNFSEKLLHGPFQNSHLASGGVQGLTLREGCKPKLLRCFRW